jgi:CRP-like cAMP-binding protein
MSAPRKGSREESFIDCDAEDDEEQNVRISQTNSPTTTMTERTLAPADNESDWSSSIKEEDSGTTAKRQTNTDDRNDNDARRRNMSWTEEPSELSTSDASQKPANSGGSNSTNNNNSSNANRTYTKRHSPSYSQVENIGIGSFFMNIADLTHDVLQTGKNGNMTDAELMHTEGFVASLFQTKTHMRDEIKFADDGRKMNSLNSKTDRKRMERTWGERVQLSEEESFAYESKGISTGQKMRIEAIHSMKEVSAADEPELDHLKSLTSSFYARKQGVLVLSPFGTFMRKWDLVIIGALVWTAIVTPAEVAFARPSLNYQFILNRIIDLFFISDLFINFLLAIPEEKTGHIIYDRKYIALAYLRTWFIIDFLSVIPSDLITILVQNSYPSAKIANLTLLRALRLFRLVKLLRILRSMRLFKRLEMRYTVDYSALALSKFAIVTVILAHWMACAFGFVHDIGATAGKDTWMESTYFGDFDINDACYDPNDVLSCVPGFDKYIAALYWSSMTITTIGYGDISPKTLEERIFVIIAMLCGAFQYGYVVGAVGNVISTKNSRTNGLKDSLTDLNELFSDFPAMTQEMRVKLREFFKYKHGDAKLDRNKTTALLNNLSPRLRAELVVLRNNWMRGIEFFHDLPESLVLALSLKMKQITFPPKEIILDKGDFLDHFYMIRKGVLVANGKIITAGQLFGQEFILEPGRTPTFLQSVTFSDIYSLSHQDLMEEVRHYPDVQIMLKKMKLRALFRREMIAYSKAYNALMLYGVKADVYKWYDERPQHYLKKLKIIYGEDGAFLINPESDDAKVRMKAVVMIQTRYRAKQMREKFKNISARASVTPLLSATLRLSHPALYTTHAIDIMHHRAVASLRLLHHKMDLLMKNISVPKEEVEKMKQDLANDFKRQRGEFWSTPVIPND